MGNNVQQETRPMGVAVAVGLLSLLLGLVFPLFAWYGYAGHGQMGIAAAGVAFGVCWLGAVLALLVAHFVRQAPAAGLLGAIFFRMGFPLIVGVWLNSLGGPLAGAGVFGMILVYYLIALAVEVVLSLRVAPIPTKSSKAI